MRPEDFSPGNQTQGAIAPAGKGGFNEAGGFLPRKHWSTGGNPRRQHDASMRPEDFSPGNGYRVSARVPALASLQ